MLVRKCALRLCRNAYSRSFTSCQVILRDEPHSIGVTTSPPPPVVSHFKLSDLPKKKASKEPKVETAVSKTTNSINLNGKAIELPPMMSYIRDVIDQYPGYIVLTQVGSFYELYFEQASEIAPLLRLTLTRREFKDYAIPMSGFPLGQLQKYISILVQDLQRGVVIVDQFKRDTPIDNDPLQFGRKVSRIITPGTLIDELFLDEQSNNFLLAIKFPEKLFTREPDPDAHVGLCWTDLSVGTLYVQETRLDDLISNVNRLQPVEILVDDDVSPELLNSSQWHKEFSHFQQYLVKYVKAKRHKTIEEYYHMFEHGSSALKRSFQEFTVKEIASLRSVLQYIENHLPNSPITLEIPQKQYPQNILHIDTRTSEALELHRSLRERFLKGSLFSSIKRTVTPGGARLLAQWLSAPSRDLKELKKRQKMVLTFAKNSPFRADVILTLSQIHDLNRIVQRLSLGRGSPLELVQLAHSLQLVDLLKEKIEDEMDSNAQAKRSLRELLENYVSKSHLSEEILKDLDEEAILLEMKVQEEERKQEINPAVVEKKGRSNDTGVELQYIVREEASPILMKLHNKLRQLESEKAELQQSLNTRLVDTGKFKEVSLKVTLGSDYLIHVRGGMKSPFNEIESLLPNAVESSRGRLTRWLDMKEWRVLGQSIDSTIFRIKAEEQNVIKELRRKVISNSTALRQIARTMEYIDVLSSFATLTVEKDLVCPKLDKSLELDIRRGRHLVVEEGLKYDLKNFTPNSCSLVESKSNWVITGPNMGGKSTFLRQNAIIVIMAQMGCFVPAESARIGLVDKIFSRVGFGDDLYNQMSTFMVEMVETNYILQGATKRSLAILDEVGRGTSGREGVALAYVTLFHLLKVNGCRVLFATHFGKEIASLLKRDGIFDSFVFKKTGVVEVNGDVVIKHDLQDGITEKSYAINVAQLAGYSPGLVQKAHDVLDYMESNSIL